MGFCTCYLKPCINIKDCAQKLITNRNSETVKNIIDGNIVSRRKND